MERVEFPIKKIDGFKIGIIYIFGSYAEDLHSSLSDIDIGVVFDDTEIITKNSFEIYDKLYRLFSDIFPESQNNLDIIILNKAPLELQFDVVKYGRVLYEKSSDFRLDYEEKIMILYADFYPVLEEINKDILNKI